MKYLLRFAIALSAALVPLVAAEAFLRGRRSFNVDAAGAELALFQGDQARVREVYTLDATLGFRPVLPSSMYGEHGTLRNDYPDEPPAGKRRVLFLGDSVVFRGRVIAALRKAYGDERYEYWNGGVSAYNTAQEVELFRRYSRHVGPHEVVLVFHPNDFQSTPIAFEDGEGRLQVIAPSKHPSRIVPWLFRWSHLYRYWVGATRTPDESDAEADIRGHLVELRELCASLELPLTVLVLPHLETLSEWPETHHRRHAWILATLAELGIPHFDLLEPMQRALADGRAIQETPGDHDHPSDEVSGYFARHLEEQGFLRSEPSVGRALDGDESANAQR